MLVGRDWSGRISCAARTHRIEQVKNGAAQCLRDACIGHVGAQLAAAFGSGCLAVLRRGGRGVIGLVGVAAENGI